MSRVPDDVFHNYLFVLNRAVINLRTRIRSGEQVPLDEVHDILDAIHNIPEMLFRYEGWFVPENIDPALADYDEKWQGKGDAKFRSSLMELLEQARTGELGF